MYLYRYVYLMLAAANYLCAMAFADPAPILWAKGYTFGESESHPHAGVETTDGGFLVVGDGVDYNNNTIVQRYIYILRTDKNGDQIWRKTFGDVGYNYGKFGIQLRDGRFLIAGAMSTHHAFSTKPVLERVLLVLNGTNGNELQRLKFRNNGWKEQLRDGFMCVAEGPSGEIAATGFVGGENATTGYVDEPMFLIRGGHVALTLLSLGTDGRLSVQQDTVLDDSGLGFRAMQGMRVVYQKQARAYAVSHTTASSPGAPFQFGLSLVSAKQGVLWTKVYPATPRVPTPGLGGHASHPYALADGGDVIAIGGLAVIFDAHHIEQCQGRVIAVDPASGELKWDHRFTSTEADTNIECYGLQHVTQGEEGFVLTCGTGVEPELHPHDSPRSKTWRVLVHRTDSRGRQLWQKVYTSNTALKNNAGEYILATSDGGYAVYVDSQTYGSPSTGGNFAIMRLGRDAI